VFLPGRPLWRFYLLYEMEMIIDSEMMTGYTLIFI
jgi:hypothetical protein